MLVFFFERGRPTRKQCSTTIQPQPPSGGSSYWISFSFSFLVVMALFLNRFMAREAKGKKGDENVNTRSQKIFKRIFVQSE